MCEFKVFVEGKIVFKDVVYAKSEENEVTVRDVLGLERLFKNYRIAEVNVNSEQLILSPIE